MRIRNMRPQVGYFFWILALAFGLMGVIAAAQILTKKNITGLKKGSQDAATIFTINNRFEALVNLSFELNTKITAPGQLPYKRQTLIDSLNMLGYNVSVLETLGMRPETKAGFENLKRFINTEVETGYTILNTPAAQARKMADSLGTKKIADSIYNAALSIQKFLEKDMQSVLGSNTATSSRLSALNKTLALIAIAAILILCAIIINRHLRQVQLIKELEKATAAAKESALIKEQFLANMSHEIRTPLNAIKGFSRLLSLTPLSAQQKEYTGIINESSGNLLNIVNDILDISKIEARKFRIDSKEFDLIKLMGSIEAMFATQAAEKGLDYRQCIDEAVPVYLKGDPDRLSQILINLVSNAIKFTHSGFVSVDVSPVFSEADKCSLRFSVSDSGKGIPADKQELIFKRFEQLYTDANDVIQGTGLGLSIVRNLSELMGGMVSVQSKDGSGATFSVLLPFAVINKTADGQLRTGEEKETDDSTVYEGANVLVVEDNKVNQLLMKKILERKGIDAMVVSNGQEALNIIAERNFDLIFLDIQMPVMDGYSASQKIRSTGNAAPVVAMTAFALPGEQAKCFEAGMNEYLAKPVDHLQLNRILKKYLSGKAAGNGNTNGYSPVYTSELLKLTGGDFEMARKILSEIAKEIPSSIERIGYNGKDAEEALRKNCHHMISTFSPMGEHTETIAKIKALNAAAEKGDKKLIEEGKKELIKKLRSLEEDLFTMLLIEE
jgi:signal transduction histidine kinase/CheY-like chemotaxis protein